MVDVNRFWNYTKIKNDWYINNVKSWRSGKNEDSLSLIDFSSAPVMEKIRFVNKKENKYIKLPEVGNVRGYVVNVHDTANLDIDLDIPTTNLENYSGVSCKNYTYNEYVNDEYSPECHVKKEGVAYRCRLRGLGASRSSRKYSIFRRKVLCTKVKQMIDRADGWVSCNLSDIDIYKRLLVDVSIKIGNDNIDLCEFLLNEVKEQPELLFYPYLYNPETFNL